LTVINRGWRQRGHHSGENLAGIEERGRDPRVIASPKSELRAIRVFGARISPMDADTDTLTCPAGQILTTKRKKDPNARHYKGRGSVCRSCPHFGVCTTDRRGRAVMVSVLRAAGSSEQGARALRGGARCRVARPFGAYSETIIECQSPMDS